LRADVSANGCSHKAIRASVQRFIKQFHRDLKEGDKSKIRQYFFKKPYKESLALLEQEGRIVSHKPLDNEDLEQMIQSGKLLSETLEKLEFLEITTIIKKPLIIEVVIREWYKRDDPYGPYDDVLYILEDIGVCKWKIIEITAPGLP
jgi:hypothetical protein